MSRPPFPSGPTLVPAPLNDASGDLPGIAALSADDALKALDASVDGLSVEQARTRLAQCGANTVTHEAGQGAIRRFLSLFFSPLSLLLLALAIVSYLSGEVRGAAVIAIMVLASTLLSFVQEFRSDKAAQRLRSMVGTTATVLRSAKHRGHAGGGGRAAPPSAADDAPARATEVALANVVPGDIVHLSAGDIVPADVRILSGKHLFVNQSALTGESMPVEKVAVPVRAHGGAIQDLENIAFMGTNIVSGMATAVVVVTGGRTAFGQVARDIAGQRELTSFDTGINRFIGLILRFMLVMVPLVFLINVLSKGDWLEALLFSVVVAVGLAPEMLPMIITINLAKGALAMADKNAVVKRLNAIQNFGAMEMLCTDKTGTLTQDKVILEKHIDAFGNDSDRVIEYAYLNSFYQTGLKSLLDVAVLKHAHIHERIKADTHYRKIDEIPFDFQRRRMSVVLADPDGERLLICKGALEEITGVCTKTERDGAIIPLEAHHNEVFDTVVRRLNDDGFRVIAVAYRAMPAAAQQFGVADESDMVLIGYIAFLDPPKDSAADAIKALCKYGVTVKVLTGDNDAVSRNVCRHVGLPVEHVLLGSDIEIMHDKQLGARVEAVSIFAKLSPQQKVRVIRALQAKGHVVGYLGDGINDAPALKAADVGISVNTAVDIAKESADIILLKKSLMVLKEGVIEGRKVFGNITKYIKMSASSNFGNMLSVLGASAFLPFLPMAPVQVLVNNLLYDFSQTTVATDHVDEDYIRQPRQWNISNIARFMLYIGPVSSLFDYLTFDALWYLFDAARDPALFQTGWFIESLLSQTLVVHVIRTSKVPFIQSKPSVPLLVTSVAICLLGFWLPWSPFAAALRLSVMPYGYWLTLPLILAAYLLATQLVKQWITRRFGVN